MQSRMIIYCFIYRFYILLLVHHIDTHSLCNANDAFADALQGHVAVSLVCLLDLCNFIYMF